jgi:hypothetical protein
LKIFFTFWSSLPGSHNLKFSGLFSHPCLPYIRQQRYAKGRPPYTCSCLYDRHACRHWAGCDLCTVPVCETHSSQVRCFRQNSCVRIGRSCQDSCMSVSCWFLQSTVMKK